MPPFSTLISFAIYTAKLSLDLRRRRRRVPREADISRPLWRLGGPAYVNTHFASRATAPTVYTRSGRSKDSSRRTFAPKRGVSGSGCGWSDPPVRWPVRPRRLQYRAAWLKGAHERSTLALTTSRPNNHA
eukprot:scaffold4183_cov41-Phaeocystis_antarctica.AAC.2